MTPKTNIVRLRLTEVEREAWSRAAGGKGRLSEWIRATCNQAANPSGLSGPGGVVVDSADMPMSVRSKPSHSLDAVGTDASKVTFEQPQSGKCSRWMHHRKGVYCGTCKQVN